MKKKIDKDKKSIFTNLDKEIRRKNQVYVNEEIMDAVIDAKKKQSDSAVDIPLKPTTTKQLKNEDTSDVNEMQAEDLDIYDSLFSETTIVSTQIYTFEIDKSLGEDNYTSNIVYRVGQDTSDIGTIFTVTKKELDKPINISRSHTNNDLNWYNDLAGLGYSYAAVCGTTVQGVIICEPQYWNSTLFIRHLAVGKKYRLNGIGRKLIEECVHRAQVEGLRALTLEVTSSNGTAIDFYKKMHFNIVGMNVGLYSNSDILKEDVGIFMHRIIV